MTAYVIVMPEKSAEENLRSWWNHGGYCCTMQLIAPMEINDLGEQR